MTRYSRPRDEHPADLVGDDRICSNCGRLVSNADQFCSGCGVAFSATAEPARKLLWKEGTSEGFERLKAEHRLDLSMEALMLRPEFQELFTAAELARAAERLSAHGYPQGLSREGVQ